MASRLIRQTEMSGVLEPQPVQQPRAVLFGRALICI